MLGGVPQPFTWARPRALRGGSRVSAKGGDLAARWERAAEAPTAAGDPGCSLNRRQVDRRVLQAAAVMAKLGAGAGDVQKLNADFQNKEE